MPMCMPLGGMLDYKSHSGKLYYVCMYMLDFSLYILQSGKVVSSKYVWKKYLIAISLPPLID